ncbi:hypothetical protein [Haemophilus haemolyticus]|uniref:hypothetical protein n=1 Tax=Haemophilus haemolyticus TaxID=726 RepID=UPI000E57FCE5|nr:hypothetical protein [Haemophilus haemolyticus]
MEITNIISFLNPITIEQSTGNIEPLPLFFFTLILIVFLVTVISTKLNAKTESWEKNWLRDQNKKISKLDIEQGSVIDLSQLIATKSEKVADVMPGIILIIGLLGTFIGLGLALDKASSILGSANPDSMNDSMAQLMGMMEGLGTKFKTSTWGLMAFLLLKGILGGIGYEHKRLVWCSEKINAELEALRNSKQEKDDKFHSSLIASINKLEMEVTTSQSNHSESISSLLVENHKDKQELDKNSTNSLLDKMEEIFSKQERLIDKQINVMNQLSIKQNELLTNLTTNISGLFSNLFSELKLAGNKNSEILNNSLKSLNKTLSEQLVSQHDELTGLVSKHHTEKQKIDNEANKSLLNATERLNKQLSQQHHSLSELFSRQHTESLDKLTENHQQSLNILKDTIHESKLSREAMERFVNENSKTVESLQNSASNMSEASSQMGDSASKLQAVIDSLSINMTDLMEKLNKDLGGTIENMDQSFSGNMAEMTSNLGETIRDMNDSFKVNMTEMTMNLNQATSDISHAVNHLSSEVGATMDNVSNNIKEAMDMQTKSQVLFSSMADALQEEVTEMTGLVNKLSNDILSGLAKISESNRNVASLNKKYNTSTEQIEELINAVTNTVNNVKDNIDVVNSFKLSIKDLVLSNSNINDLVSKIDSNSKELGKLITVANDKSGSYSNIVTKLDEIKQILRA